MESVHSVLTEDERAFLAAHSIPLSKVFDAEGMRAKDYRALMREEEIPFACRTTPCQAGGHRLRTRKGHCVQCDPAKIAFMLRWNDPGAVYVAWSPSRRLVKVGSTRDATARISMLNGVAYGGANDWAIEFDAWCEDDAGVAEARIHAALAKWQAQANYWNGVRTVQCRELYRCGLEHALAVCSEVVDAEWQRRIANNRSRQCPRCGARNTASYLYGEPDFNETFDQLNNGDIVFGGCCIIWLSPKYHCNECEHDWGQHGLPPS